MQRGDIVDFTVETGRIRPAIVTRVHSATVVNLQVFCDGDDAVLLGANTSVPRLTVVEGVGAGRWQRRP